METQTQVNPTAVVPQTPAQTVIVVDYDELVHLLLERTIGRDGRGDVFIVDYSIDMLKKGKLSAAARSAFPNGIFHVARQTIQVNYDYGKKLENRTDGAEHAKGGNWQYAVTVNNKYTPFSTHKNDVANDKPLTLISGARLYLRYEPLTEEQRDSGFGKGDFSKYMDIDGNEIAYVTVKPFFFARKEQAVSHRTLTIGNVTAVRFGGNMFQVR